MSIPIVDVETLTGARVRVFDGEGWPELNASTGGGFMFMIDMLANSDGRHAEVFLDTEAAAALAKGMTMP